MAETQTIKTPDCSDALVSPKMFCSISDRERYEQQLQADIDLLKNPVSFRARFERVGEIQFIPAIEILRRLQVETYSGPLQAGFETLRNAKFHLDRALEDASFKL